MEAGIPGTRRRRWLSIVGWILVIGFLTYRMSPDLAARFGTGSVGTMMPAFSAKTIDGATLNREGLLGKVMLVNFWAAR